MTGFTNPILTEYLPHEFYGKQTISIPSKFIRLAVMNVLNKATLFRSMPASLSMRTFKIMIMKIFMFWSTETQGMD